MPNRLVHETSPYLLQHANNPVDWYPWGEEAFEEARSRDKPVLLSVGYSACHWCHVMERESFEHFEIARTMNDNFVCVKVDREERPDVDAIYMTAVQAMTGQGGWPMTVFLTPDGKPFYGGTYFPPRDRGPMPGFPRVLEAISRYYSEHRGEVDATSARLIEQIERYQFAGRGVEPLTPDLLQRAYSGIRAEFDHVNGGTGSQPKFPQPMVYEFLLRHHVRTGSPDALEMVELTLDKMARGGIYDQLGGGFHRYSTDAIWLVPHFEKMLYDNALLVKLYLHTYQVTRKPLYRKVIEQTLEYVMREMTGGEGGFYSAQDADSEGVEGKFFVWRPDEIKSVLGEDDGELVNLHFGVTQHGNFEGRSILFVDGERSAALEKSQLSEEEFDALLERCRGRLLEHRERRIKPERDDKVLTAWNGLMLRAFAEAASILEESEYASVARKNADFLLTRLLEDGRLKRSFKDGDARLNAYLEDYAFLIDGLLALHEATFESRWLEAAIELGRTMIDLFWDEDEGRMYDTSRDHEKLIVRPRDVSDNAVPSGGSMAVDVLLRLAIITGDRDMERVGATALRSVRELMLMAPLGAGQWLCALDMYLSEPREIAIVARRGEPAADALAAEVFRHYIPNRVMVGAADPAEAVESPLLESREAVDSAPTAYVCRNYVCQLPVTEPQTLANLLAS